MLKKHFLLIIVILVLVLFSAVTVFAQEQSYTVQPGDTIQRIANAFNVTVDAILIRNGIIDPNRIQRGQVLIIPIGGLTPPRTHTVKAGERLSDIAIRYNTTIAALVAVNTIPNQNNLVPGQVLNLPPIGGPITFPVRHVVDTGETLRTIAERYGTTWQAIATANNLANPNYIQAGTVLTIPAPGFGTGGPVVTPTPTTPTQPTTPGPVLPRRVVNGRYTVQAGDNMFAIASEFGVNIYTIAQANGLLNLNAIYTGQSLLIPGR